MVLHIVGVQMLVTAFDAPALTITGICSYVTEMISFSDGFDCFITLNRSICKSTLDDINLLHSK